MKPTITEEIKERFANIIRQQRINQISHCWWIVDKGKFIDEVFTDETTGGKEEDGKKIKKIEG